jgi:hypothetical protein
MRGDDLSDGYKMPMAAAVEMAVRDGLQKQEQVYQKQIQVIHRELNCS